MVTRRGTVKKTELTAFKRPLGRGIIALGLEENDQLIGVARVKAGHHVILSTRDGMAIRFDEAKARSMGRPAYGVNGIDLLRGGRGRRHDRRQRRGRRRAGPDSILLHRSCALRRRTAKLHPG